MRNSKIFSFVKLSKNSMVASVRIAYWLENFLQVPLVCDGSIADKQLDTLVIVNGAYGFSKFLEPLGKAVEEARRVVWVQNDYTIVPPKDDSNAMSPFRRAFVNRRVDGKHPVAYWSTCEEFMKKNHLSSYVNWNMLTFDPAYDKKMVAKRRQTATMKDTLFYYGSFRDTCNVAGGKSGKMSRVVLFDRYFKQPHVRTVVSSPSDKFANRYGEIETIEQITDGFYRKLGNYGLGLYIEDRKSSERFHSPANRFYEMLSAGLPMVFQPEAVSGLRRAGFDASPYVVNNAMHVKRRMEEIDEIGKTQSERWIGDDPLKFRKMLLDQVDDARSKLP